LLPDLECPSATPSIPVRPDMPRCLEAPAPLVEASGSVEPGNPAERGAEEAAGLRPGTWACAACTFVNETGASHRCEVCDTARSLDAGGDREPDDVRAPDPAVREALRPPPFPFLDDLFAPPPLPPGPVSGDPVFDGLLRYVVGGGVAGGLIGFGSALLQGRSARAGAAEGALAGALAGGIYGISQDDSGGGSGGEDALGAARDRLSRRSALRTQARRQAAMEEEEDDMYRLLAALHTTSGGGGVLFRFERGGDAGRGLPSGDQLELFGQHGGRRATEEAISSLPSHAVGGVEKNDGCPICMEKVVAGDVVKRLPCLHCFHAHCVDKWLRTSARCPMCNRPVDA